MTGMAESAPVDALPVLGRFTSEPEPLIAHDFVKAMIQVEGFDPRSRPIRLPRRSTMFERALEDALVNRGFTVERVDVRTGPGVMMSSVVQAPGDVDGGEFVYMIALDRLGLRRRYRVADDMVAPVSSLFVRGAEPTSIQLDDAMFLEDAPALMDNRVGNRARRGGTT